MIGRRPWLKLITEKHCCRIVISIPKWHEELTPSVMERLLKGSVRSLGAFV